MKQWQTSALIALAVAILLFAGSFLFPAAYYVCAPNDYTHAKECAPHHFGPFILLGLVAVADVHNGIITAIASVVVAAFTATLWFVTNKGLDLARDEFNASHRPQITVHHVEAIWGVIRNADGKKFKAVGAKVTYFNKGSVAATNVEIRGRIVTKNKQFSHLEGALMAPTIDCPNNVISGKTYSFEVQSQVTADAADGIEIDDPYGGVVQRSEIDVYCIGIIAYSDSSSVKRQTGFIWRWRTPFSWIRETNSPYHFEY